MPSNNHDQYDLSFVPPARRNEVLRRLRVIDKYLANPGSEAAEAARAELGLGRSSFYRLASIFRRTRDPGAIGTFGERRHGSHLSEPQEQLVREAIASVPDRSAKEILKTIDMLASAACVTMPTRVTLRRYVALALAGQVPAELSGGAHLVVDHCVLEMPVVDALGCVGRPTATVVIDLQDLQVLGLALSTTPPSAEATAAALLDALAKSPGRKIVRQSLRIEIDQRSGWAELLSAVAEAGFCPTVTRLKPRSCGKAVSRALGERLGGAKIRKEGVWKPLADRPARLKTTERPMTLEEATELVKARELRDRGRSGLRMPDPRSRLTVLKKLEKIASRAPSQSPQDI